MERTPWFLYLSLAVAALLSYWLLRVRSARRSACNCNLPPGPTPLPLVGSLFELGAHPHRSLANLAKTHGPVISLHLGRITTIVVSTPAAAREVLQTHDHHLSARSVPAAVSILGHERVSVIWVDPSSDHWKHLRSVYRTHLLSPRMLDAGRALRHRKVRDLLAHVRRRPGRALDVGRAAFATALNIISNTAFSMDMVDAEGESAHEFKELIWAIMEEVGAPNISDFFPAVAFLDPQGNKRRSTAHFKKLFAVFDNIIDTRLHAMISPQEEEGSSNPKSPDLLDSLLSLHLQEKGKMDRPTIKSLLADIFIAGTDTVSLTVEWAMAELLRNPAAMATARAEVRAVVGPGSEVEESDVSGLPYIQAVVKETLRLHPPVPLLLPRRAERGVELCGYTVPEGTRLLVNVWAIGRDKGTWERPEVFSPERFAGSEVDVRGRDFELTPFGSGRRMCPGLQLGLSNAQLMLASLLHSFDWALPGGMEPGDVDMSEKFGVTLGKALPLHAVALPTN